MIASCHQIDDTLTLKPVAPEGAAKACQRPEARIWLDLQGFEPSELEAWLDKRGRDPEFDHP